MALPVQTVDRAFFFLLLIAVTLAFLGLITDFLKPVFWALVLALLFQPLQRYMLRTIPDRPSLGAALTLITIVFLVLIPVFLVVVAVAREAAEIARDLEQGNIRAAAVFDWLQARIPAVTSLLDRFGVELSQIRQGLSTAAVAAGRWVATNAVTIGQGTVMFFLQLFVMLYLLFFFLRDGVVIIQRIRHALPLDDALARHLAGRFAIVSRATLKGTFLIGAIQGFMGGVTFWLLDLRAPILWGVVMGLLALLPAVGPPLVWIPAAVWLIATGALVKGLVLVVLGTVIIGLVDNLLRPILVVRDAGLPDYIILLSTLGGISMFGLSGVLIGPIIAALFFSVWHSFENQRTSPETVT